MVKRTGSIRSEDEELKSIPVCDLFYRVAKDTAGPLPETKSGNKYILVAIATIQNGVKQELWLTMEPR
jgi:hypothetical protein